MPLDELEDDDGVPSGYVLVFDTETTNDAAQNLIIGTYQAYKGQTLCETGIFYDPVVLEKRNGNELTTLQAYATRYNKKCKQKNEQLKIRTASEFVEEVFYFYGYDARGTIVGLNLAFDISRLATEPRRLSLASDLFRGGFTLKLSPDYERPRIQIKHISSKLSFFQFSDKPSNAQKREKGASIPIRRGFFIDVRTLATALTSTPHTLKSLANTLKTKTRKAHIDVYGEILKTKDIDYALQDTQVTWECYQKLLGLYHQHQLFTPPYKIYSEASLGKSYLKTMGIESWRKQQKEFAPELIGVIMSTYFGGRAEVHIRRQVEQVMYCDFLSMYPTVCTLMKLWDFVVAKGIQDTDATVETQELLERITLDELINSDLWPLLCVLVQVQPEKDIFPVRAQYGDDATFTIGVNEITSGEPLWYTLADCIASKLLTGKAPKVIKAVSFAPLDKQDKLKPVDIMGNPEYQVDPTEGSFFARLIDLRTKIKKANKSQGDKSAQLKYQEQSLKIIANATSYGIFVELIDIKTSGTAKVMCHSHNETPFTDYNEKYEKPGTYFHPLLATLITGAARLLLAMAERHAINEGLDWVLCDTDSMAFSKSKAMPDKTFYRKVGKICATFANLSPYEGKPSILKIEDENFRDGEYHPLFCLAVSAKRYALFNIDSDNKPDIRKVSAHGLGHLRDPYLSNKNMTLSESVDEPESEEEQDKAEISKVKPWHKEFWRCIVDAALNGNVNQPDYSSVRGLHKHAASIFSTSTPEHLEWFKKYNTGKNHYEKVKPFNFMLIFKEDVLKPKDSDSKLFPIAPYDRDLSVAVQRCFDRKTGDKVTPDKLATYQDDRGRYHLHPESKFHPDNSTYSGIMQRKHVIPTQNLQTPAILVIGKEANALEERLVLGNDADQQKQHLNKTKHSVTQLELIRQAIGRHGLRSLARATKLMDGKGITANALNKIDKGLVQIVQKRTLNLLQKAIAYLDKAHEEDEKLLLLARQEAADIGSTAFSRNVKYDRANIDKFLSGKRKFKRNSKIRQKLVNYFAKQLAEPQPLQTTA